MFRMYDIMWREGMMELLDQLEAENPDESILVPKVALIQELYCLENNENNRTWQNGLVFTLSIFKSIRNWNQRMIR